MMPQTIPAAFAVQVRERPEACAVRFGDVQLTYRELDRRADALAHRLHALGVGPESPVGVLMDRSEHLVVALLAVVKAGGCYLPLHSADPFERMQWIMDETAAPVLLADRARRGRGLPHAPGVVIVDAEPAPAEVPGVPAARVDPDQLAYIIHTSGSTGRPKGVAVSHRTVTALVGDQMFADGAHERVLMVAPYAFNVSTYEFWVPLLRGGTVVVAPPGPLDLRALRRLVAAERITGVHLTAGLFRVLAEEDPAALAGVREVLTGGDVISPDAVRRVLDACPGTVVRAMYGATECTLFSTSAAMAAPSAAPSPVPVGRPMDGVRLHLLDERLAPVGPGEAGDVYLSGRLARGYHGRPDLTAERFVADPFGEPGERMYRTGDRGRWTADGQLDFLGRADDQVKVRGFRIELGEVESALAAHPGLAHAAVTVASDGPGGGRLLGYYVPRGGGVGAAELRSHLDGALPDYMVPAEFVELTELPLTPNGKVDRRALPAPRPAPGDGAPEGARQEVLCAAFAEVLGVESVRTDASFFELGGQSLLAMQLLRRIEERLGVEASMADLFDSPTVAELSRRLGDRLAGSAD